MRPTERHDFNMLGWPPKGGESGLKDSPQTVAFAAMSPVY